MESRWSGDRVEISGDQWRWSGDQWRSVEISGDQGRSVSREVLSHFGAGIHSAGQSQGGVGGGKVHAHAMQAGKHLIMGGTLHEEVDGRGGERSDEVSGLLMEGRIHVVDLEDRIAHLHT